MNKLANTLRMYAEDMHSRTGFNYISRTMSQAADTRLCSLVARRLTTKNATPAGTSSPEYGDTTNAVSMCAHWMCLTLEVTRLARLYRASPA